MEEEKYIKKWLSGELTEQEWTVFKASKDFQSLHRLDRALQAFKSPEYSVEEELQKVSQLKSAGNSPAFRVRAWMKIAASLLLIATAIYVFFPMTKSEMTQVIAKSGNTAIFLPDSSSVILNKGSTLAYDAGKWDGNRKVTLEGEAFFEVKKGSSFEVITVEGKVNVLGTAFNVAAWPGFFAVNCFHGKVAVTKEKKEVILLANQQLQYHHGNGGNIGTFESTQPAWMLGESSFEGVPLQFVLKALERRYEIKVVTRSVDTQRSFSGSFTHTDLDLALRSISIPLNLQYEINGSEVVLMRESPD